MIHKHHHYHILDKFLQLMKEKINQINAEGEREEQNGTHAAETTTDRKGKALGEDKKEDQL